MVPAFPLPQERLNPLLPPQDRLLASPPPHLLTDILARTLAHLQQMHAMVPRPRGLAPATHHDKQRQRAHKQPIAHIQRVLLLGPVVVGAAPLLPVLPGGIPGGTAGLAAPGAVGSAERGVGQRRVGGGGPTGAVEVVGAAADGVGEDGVSGDDKAVAVELGVAGEEREGGVRVAVGVVELD